MRLSPRTIAIACDLAHFGLMTTQQIGRAHFSLAHPRTVNNYLLRVRGAQEERIFSRTLDYPKGTEDAAGSLTAGYYLTAANVRNILQSLKDHGQYALAGELIDLQTRKLPTHDHFTHDVGITEFLLTLMEATALEFSEVLNNAKILEWFVPEKRLDILLEGRIKSRPVRFNPDAVFGMQKVYFVEFDNDSENMGRWQQKLLGYFCLLENDTLPAVLRFLSERHNLALASELLVLTATPNEERRNKLLRETSLLPKYRKHFLFCSMTDVTRETILSKVWLSAEDYRPLYDKEKALPKGMKPSVKAQWIRDAVAEMPRRSIVEPW